MSCCRSIRSPYRTETKIAPKILFSQWMRGQGDSVTTLAGFRQLGRDPSSRRGSPPTGGSPHIAPPFESPPKAKQFAFLTRPRGFEPLVSSVVQCKTGPTGFEPETSSVIRKRSTELSYGPRYFSNIIFFLARYKVILVRFHLLPGSHTIFEPRATP